MGKLLPCAALTLLAVLLLPMGTAAAQGCRISMASQPPVVNFPGQAFPGQGTSTFYEVVNVNYSSAYVNRTVVLQYFNGTQWRGLAGFTGNQVGFTEEDVGLDSSWARFGGNAVRALSGPCTSNETSFVVRPDASAIPEAVTVYVLAAVALGLFYVLGKRLGKTRLVLLAAAVYLAVSPFTGQRYDIYFLLSSGIRVLQHVGPFDPGSPPLYPGSLKWANPPLYAFYSAVSFLVYQVFTGAQLPSVSALTYPGWLTSTYSVWLAYIPSSLPVLVFLLKLPMVASAILTGVLLARTTGDRSVLLNWVANPMVILVAAVWGQLDPIATLLAVAAIYSFQKGKMYQAYAFASFGAAVKVWPALLIPILLVVSARSDGRRALRPLLAVLPALLLTLAMYGVYGNLLEGLSVFVYARGIPTYAGQFTVNGLTWQQVLFVLKSPPLPVFLAVGIPAYLTMLGWMYWRKERDVAKWLTVAVLLFFLTYNYVNPQYFYWILPLLMLGRRRLATALFTALPLVFMAVTYNIFYFVSPALLPDEFALGASVAEQIKVNFLYAAPSLLVVVAGLIPTAAYGALLYHEIRLARKGHAENLETS